MAAMEEKIEKVNVQKPRKRAKRGGKSKFFKKFLGKEQNFLPQKGPFLGDFGES